MLENNTTTQQAETRKKYDALNANGKTYVECEYCRQTGQSQRTFYSKINEEHVVRPFEKTLLKELLIKAADL